MPDCLSSACIQYIKSSQKCDVRQVSIKEPGKIIEEVKAAREAEKEMTVERMSRPKTMERKKKELQ